MPRGGQRPGAGRPKGSLNKKSQAIRERLESELDPIGKLIDLINKTPDQDLRLRAILGLMPYGYPRLRASSVDLAAQVKQTGGVLVLPGIATDEEWEKRQSTSRRKSRKA